MKRNITFLFAMALLLIPVVIMVINSSYATGEIKVQLYNGNTNTITNSIHPKIRLINQSSMTLNLATVTIRYYYTVDGDKSQNYWCDYAAITSPGHTPITSSVIGKFVKMDTTANGADYYLEIGFASGAGSLVPGGTVEIQSRFAKTDWSDYTQTGDYSFNPSLTNYTDSTIVTAYVSGTLQWGAEPGGSVPTATPTPTVIVTPTPTSTIFPTPTGIVGIPWDWTGIVGTGQSLSVGAEANPAVTTNQPYHNLKLSLGNLTVPPWDPNNNALSMVPLVEPIRSYATGYPSAYPRNIYGETPHTAMANQISSLALSGLGIDYITVHTVVGESGQGMNVIKKGATDTGSTGRAYAASLFEVEAIKRLAATAGKTYGVGGIMITHGETDAGNTNYQNELRQMWSDYNTDLRAITGQSQKILLFTNQQHSCPNTGTSASTLAQWLVGVNYPDDIICTGPKYQYPYAGDGIHLNANGYQQLGEKTGQVYYEKVILGHDWRPLQPINVERTSSTVITVDFHVPVEPLVWDTTLPAPHQSALTEWRNGKGFEVYTTGGSRITIASVAISGNSVIITCANPLPASGVKVGYAFTGGGDKRANGTFRWGLLRDSDPFKGSTTGIAQPNFCVAFELDVP